MTQPSLFDQAATNRRRDRQMARVAANAEEKAPSFADQARAFVLAYLALYGPTSGERITVACKLAGIVPHDDRAFGPVYHGLAARGQIVKVGTVRRERGHGTSGGNVWARPKGVV